MEELCTACAARSFFSPPSNETRESHVSGAASHVASLARAAPAATIALLVALRIEQTINGKSYVIEVLPVGEDRWRAQIARRPGGTTALMPFYGATPDEAAASLSQWLTRASAS